MSYDMPLAAIAFGPPNVTPSEMLAALFGGLFAQTVIGLILVNLWEEMTWMGFVHGFGRLRVAIEAALELGGVSNGWS